MQMSLVNHFDKQYSLLGLLGYTAKQKANKNIVRNDDQGGTSEFNIQKLLALKSIDYNMSLHTKQIQSSSYVKIDDNLLNFAFERLSKDKAQQLSDEKIQRLSKELNRVHLKFLSQDQVLQRRDIQIQQRR